MPCYGLNALVPVSGDSISCTLKVGTYPVVIVKNFKTITANSLVRMIISGIINPSTASYGV